MCADGSTNTMISPFLALFWVLSLSGTWFALFDKFRLFLWPFMDFMALFGFLAFTGSFGHFSALIVLFGTFWQGGGGHSKLASLQSLQSIWPPARTLLSVSGVTPLPLVFLTQDSEC